MEKFNIKNYPDDVYSAVGQIIKEAQNLEKDFKILCKKLDLKIKNLNKSSLNKLNDALNKSNFINSDEYELLEKIIKVRNHINHYFFLNEFDKKFENFDDKIAYLENFLNYSIFYIFEADDFINNLIDKMNNSKILRPTIFD